MKKREIEIAERAIARIALEHHTTVEEVRLQIKVAMLNGLVSDDPKIKAYWKSIPHEGDVPEYGGLELTAEAARFYTSGRARFTPPGGHILQ